MAIAEENFKTDEIASGVQHNGHSFAYECNGDPIIVRIHSGHTAINFTVSSVTYDGDALAVKATEVNDADADTHIYSRDNPSSGSNQLVVTFANNYNLSSAVHVTSYTGADTVQNGQSGQGVANTAVETVNTAEADSWVIGAVTWHGDDLTPLAQDEGILDYDSAVGAGSSIGCTYGGGHTVAGAAGAHQWGANTDGGSDGFAICAVELTEAAAPPAGAIMNQLQQSNLGADLFDGSIL